MGIDLNTVPNGSQASGQIEENESNSRIEALIGYGEDYGSREARQALANADAGVGGGGGGGGGTAPADVAAGINASTDIDSIISELQAINANTDELEIKLDGANVNIDNVEINTQDIEDILNGFELGAGTTTAGTQRVVIADDQFADISNATTESALINDLDTLATSNITPAGDSFLHAVAIVEGGSGALANPIEIKAEHADGGSTVEPQQIYNLNRREWETSITQYNEYYLIPFYSGTTAFADYGAVGDQAAGTSLRLQYSQKEISGLIDDSSDLDAIKNSLEGNNANSINDLAFTATQTAQEASPADLNTLELYVQNKSDTSGELLYIRNNGAASAALSISLGPGGSHIYKGFEAQQALSVLSNVANLPVYIKRTNG